MSDFKRRFLVAGLLFGTALGGITCKPAEKPLPPELQAMMDKVNRIQNEMSEKEVDAIRQGYHAGISNQPLGINDNGKPLLRESVKTKFYGKEEGIEGDYIIKVYFDRQGKVVGKLVSVLIK